MNTKYFPSLALVSSLLLLAGCGWFDGNGGGGGYDPDNPKHVIVWRPNVSGGSDLHETSADGRSPVVNLTDNVLDSVDLTRPPIHVRQENRIVYAAGRGGVINLFTVVADQNGRRSPQRLTEFGRDELTSYEVVGTRVVVDAIVGGVQNLWSVSVDGRTQLRRLSTNVSTEQSIHWQRDFQAADRWIFFEMSRQTGAGVSTNVLAADLASDQPASPVTVAQDVSTVYLTTPPGGDVGAPLVRGKWVVLQSRDRNGTSVQFELADLAGGAAKPLTRSFLTAVEQVRDATLVADRLVFVYDNLTGFSANVHSVPLSGQGALPGPWDMSLTNFVGSADAPQDLHYIVTPYDDTLVGVAVQPDVLRKDNHFVDVFSVSSDVASSFRLLSQRETHANTVFSADDIDVTSMLVLGRAVVYARAAHPGRVWQATLAQVSSEREVFNQGDTRQFMLLPDVVRDSKDGVDEVRQLVRAAFVTAVARIGDQDYANLLSLLPNGAAVRPVVLSEQATLTGHIVFRGIKQDRVVYTRAGTLNTADFERRHSELIISSSTTSLDAVHVFPRNQGHDRVFFEASGQLFSAPITSGVEAGRVRQLSAIATASQAVTQVHFANSSRLVYSVGTTSVVTVAGSPVDPVRPTANDVSRSISTADVFVMAF